MGDAGPRIELAGATRRFGSLVAVAQLDLELVPGRIHALIGENGAGKSTALKMVAGHLAASAGQVRVDGSPLTPATPHEAIRRGVGMVHQHFMLVERMTALDNLMLGAEMCASSMPWLGRLDRQAAASHANTIIEDTGLSVPLDVLVADLSVGQRQRLEILRVLFRGARAVLLDEPTAVLSPVEVDELYATLRVLADAGRTIAVVTHRLDEVVRFCDHVSVMRRGAGVLDEALERGTASEDRLTRAIMGGEVPPPAEPTARASEEPALILKGPIDLTVHKTEVIGIAGIEGNGQRELARAIAGLADFDGLSLELGGQPLDDAMLPVDERIRARRSKGIVVVHEDRHHDELLMPATVADNLVLGDLDGLEDEAKVMRRRFERFDVHPSDPERRARELSGGNQQKVVMARALDRKIALLLLAQPTRGVDIGTARTIHHAVAQVAEDGAGVLLISADLNELRSLAHRILVMRKGRIVGSFAVDASDQEIGRAMLGVTEEADAVEGGT